MACHHIHVFFHFFINNILYLFVSSTAFDTDATLFESLLTSLCCVTHGEGGVYYRTDKDLSVTRRTKLDFAWINFINTNQFPHFHLRPLQRERPNTRPFSSLTNFHSCSSLIGLQQYLRARVCVCVFMCVVLRAVVCLALH